MLAVYVSAFIESNPAKRLVSNGSTRSPRARMTDSCPSRVSESGSSKPNLC